VKQNVRNSVVLGTFGLAMMAANGGCSDEPTGGFNGFGNNGNSSAGTGNSSSGGSSAGTFSSTAGTNSPTTGGMPGGVAGTSFLTSGAPSTAGTPGTAGGGAGGAGTAGSAGAGTAGSAGAGTAGTGGGGSCPAPTGVHTGTAFADTCFSLTASHCAATAQNMNPPEGVLDGDAMTRWSSGGAMDTARKYTFIVDLGSAVSVSGVLVTTDKGDVPPEVEIAVSDTANGAFTPVACATGLTGNIDAGFAATTARFVKLTQVGIKTPNWWSIHELTVYGTGTTCATGTGTYMCTVNVTQ
jgi:hypothetical protein